MTPTISLRVTGADKVQTGFNQYAQAIGPVTRESIEAAMREALKKSPGYQGGNSYAVPNGDTGPNGTPRTGNLGRTTVINTEGLSVRIVTEAYSAGGYNYAPKVLGYADGSGQAEYNTHWPTLRSAVDEQVNVLTGRNGPLDAALQAAAKEAGL